MWGFIMYYSLSFPRGNGRGRRRREEEQQVRHDVGALEHVSTDALDRADDGCRSERIGGVHDYVMFAIGARRVRRPVPVGVPSTTSRVTE